MLITFALLVGVVAFAGGLWGVALGVRDLWRNWRRGNGRKA